MAELDLPDLYDETLDVIEAKVALKDIAALCRTAEEGDSKAAAEKAVEVFKGSQILEGLWCYSAFGEKDILSFYRQVKKPIEISGKLGTFVLWKEQPPACYEGPPIFTPLGLWALGVAIRELVPEYPSSSPVEGEEEDVPSDPVADAPGDAVEFDGDY